MFQLKIINILFFCLFLWTGCSKKQSKAMIVKPSAKVSQLEESVARMTHIPDALFGFRLQAVIPDEQNAENVQIVYHPVKGSLIDAAMVKKYYEVEMEVLGWQIASTYQSTDELLVLFFRPNNVWCQVMLSHENILTVLLLTKKDQS